MNFKLWYVSKISYRKYEEIYTNQVNQGFKCSVLLNREGWKLVSILDSLVENGTDLTLYNNTEVNIVNNTTKNTDLEARNQLQIRNSKRDQMIKCMINNNS